jgi:hypothetical protein
MPFLSRRSAAASLDSQGSAIEHASYIPSRRKDFPGEKSSSAQAWLKYMYVESAATLWTSSVSVSCSGKYPPGVAAPDRRYSDRSLREEFALASE